jgi:lysophospholipase L1-like esterase
VTLPLTAFRSHLVAGKATSPLHVLNIGDSVTESTGATSTSLRYATRLLAALQAEYNPTGVAGGLGYVNTFHNSATPSGWTMSAGGGGQNTDGLLGFRGRSWITGQTGTFTFTGTSFTLHFTKGTAFASIGQFTVSIDGGAPITVTPASDPQNYRGIYTSATLSHGTHTVVCTPTSGHQLYLFGAHAFDGDETAGIHGWEAGHFGTTAAGYLAGNQLTDYCALYDPALVTILLGLNDLSSSTTAASYSSSISSLITQIRGYCAGTPSFLLLSPYARTDLTGPQAALVPQYASALSTIDSGDSNVDFYDLSAYFVPSSSPSYMSDAVHPNDAGHQQIATLIAQQITGSGTPPPPPPSSGWTTVAAERWNGTTWESLVAEKWNGSAWVSVVLERAT